VSPYHLWRISSIVGLPSQVCNQHVIHPNDAKKAQTHRDECSALVAKLAKRVRDSSIECGICLEKVMTKAEMSQRRFGLMACEHPFCLGCIRNWRSTGEVNAKTVSCKHKNRHIELWAVRVYCLRVSQAFSTVLKQQLACFK
jgi:hypothetical protein